MFLCFAATTQGDISALKADWKAEAPFAFVDVSNMDGPIQNIYKSFEDYTKAVENMVKRLPDILEKANGVVEKSETIQEKAQGEID
jgi:hypothetical protein